VRGNNWLRSLRSRFTGEGEYGRPRPLFSLSVVSRNQFKQNSLMHIYIYVGHFCDYYTFLMWDGFANLSMHLSG
jgi:hypothetical protein